MTPVSITDYRQLAQRRLPRVLFDYIDGGAYAETTLRANVADFEAVRLRQRVMCDVSQISTATTLFGRDVSMPVGLGPVGLSGMYARRGEVQAARAAAAANVPFCLSTVSICSVAEVTQGAGPIWFQLYMIKDRGYMAELLAEAGRCACPVLVFTVDLPVAGVRYKDARRAMGGSGAFGKVQTALDGLAHPAWLWDVQLNGGPHLFGNLSKAVPDAKGVTNFWGWVKKSFDPGLTWEDLEWIRSHWKGPIVIKGILDRDDANQAVACGADGVVVSNHGGRQLDGVPSSIAALPEVAEAVDGRATVLMDGGIRSGLDVLKALALGADGCLVGRAWAWSLAGRGQAGVAHMLDILRGELEVAMALTGLTDVRKAGRQLLVGSHDAPKARAQNKRPPRRRGSVGTRKG
jgi:L-lactate dehydrogenase (cytochrome)